MILSAVFGFILGVFIGSFFQIPIWILLTTFSFAFLFLCYSHLLLGKSKVYLIAFSIFILSFSVGVFRISISNLYKSSQLESFVGQKIEARGEVSAEPDARESNTKLTIKINEINSKKLDKPENVLVSTFSYPEFSYGDKVKLEIKLEKPENFETDGRIFNYVGYLKVRGIWYTADYGKVELLAHGKGNPIKYYLFKIKNAFKNSIGKALSEPEGSLMNGILLGAKQSLGKDLLSEFQRTGTSHIVVLSGYNIAIVADSVMSTLSFLPKNLSFGFGITSIILFTILSGGGASAVRAAIMVIVALSAKRFNRDYKAKRALGFAVVLLLAPNPLLLVFDPSFQLSILATIGLVFATPIISKYLKFITEKYGLREIVGATIGTQITVLPFIIYNTGIVSLVALPINILILGTIPTTMFLGFITGVFGLLSYYLSLIPAFFTYILLWYQLTIIHFGANLKFGAINLPAFSFTILVSVYLVIFMCLYFFKNKKRHM